VLYCSLCLAICLGAARGCGWQNLCAFINLGAYYVVGIPSALLFAFVFHFGGTVGFSLSFSLSLSHIYCYCYCYSSCENGVKQGLWMGIICGLSVQVMALVIVNICTDWNHEVRIFQST
jgi:MATE family multidrug resistance protein